MYVYVSVSEYKQLDERESEWDWHAAKWGGIFV